MNCCHSDGDDVSFHRARGGVNNNIIEHEVLVAVEDEVFSSSSLLPLSIPPSSEVLKLCDDEINNAKVRERRPFAELMSSRQSSIRQKMKRKLFEYFQYYGMRNNEDCLNFLDYMGKEFGKRQKAHGHMEALIKNQMNTLELNERNLLLTLLTHRRGTTEGHEMVLNEDIIAELPVYRARSEQLLEANARGGRKERCDKIDLQFIEDFMHRVCRHGDCYLYIYIIILFVCLFFMC